MRKSIILIFCCITVIPIIVLIVSSILYVSTEGNFEDSVLGNLLNN